MKFSDAFKNINNTANPIRSGISRGNTQQYWLDMYNNPSWVSMHGKQHLLSLYQSVGIIQFIINTGVDARSNMKLKLYSLDTDKEVFETSEGLKSDQLEAVRNFYRLTLKPNPIQSQFELLKQQFVYHDLFGDSFTYANAIPVMGNLQGIPDVNSIQSLINVPSQYTKIIGTGKYFEETTIEGMIKNYEFDYNNKKKLFEPNTIFHRNDINIDFNNTDVSNRLGGRSKLLAAKKELSNIVSTLESRNVIIRKRGAEGIFTSAAGDANGSVPLQPGEKEDAQKELQKYGTLEDQDRFIITSAPLSYQKIGQNVKELGLLEGLYTDVISLSHLYNIPEILTKLYINGATFENNKEAKRQLYEENVIPKSNDWATAYNSFLKLTQYGLYCKADFSHIPVLQENLKDAANVRLQNNKVYESQFLNSSITWNRYLNLMGEPKREDAYGDMYYYQLPPEVRTPNQIQSNE